MSFQDHSLTSNIIVFILAAVAVWLAGSRLSVQADVIASRTGLGGAFVGLLLLAGVTSLPEVATTLTAAAIGNPELLTSALLGGIAMQTAILAVMDLLLVRKGPLTYFTPDPKLLIAAVMLVALLGIVVVGIAMAAPLSFWGISPWTGAAFAFYLLMLWVTHSESTRPQWRALNPPPEPREEEGSGGDAGRDEVPGGRESQRTESERYSGVSSGRLALAFVGASVVILIAGYVLTNASDAIAEQTGLGSTITGAILVAITTSLPEVSTTAKAIRIGAYSMAFTNIFGSNAFCVALLFLGDIVYRPGPVLAAASPAALYLTGLGILVTCAYLWGILERKNKTVLRMDIASVVVLVLYLGGVVLMSFVL